MLFMFILKILVAVVVVVILITMIYHLYTPTAEERKGPSASRFSHAFICIKIKIYWPANIANIYSVVRMNS